MMKEKKELRSCCGCRSPRRPFLLNHLRAWSRSPLYLGHYFEVLPPLLLQPTRLDRHRQPPPPPPLLPREEESSLLLTLLTLLVLVLVLVAVLVWVLVRSVVLVVVGTAAVFVRAVAEVMGVAVSWFSPLQRRCLLK